MGTHPGWGGVGTAASGHPPGKPQRGWIGGVWWALQGPVGLLVASVLVRGLSQRPGEAEADIWAKTF